ncbi:hypothetical protein [Chromobacterium violaceum]|uniref:hypothetical protein n=1 Tax=Chromobacterium violaceum TaxID=536 RepID=UPI003CF7E222
MSITPNDILNTANKLLTNGASDEACYRSATSRAYYAAFHKAIEHANKRNLPKPTKSKNPHEDEISRFDLANTPQDSAIATDLRQLKYLRKKADYKLQNTITLIESQMQIQMASKLMSLL